jgi:diaminopimelate epimerase
VTVARRFWKMTGSGNDFVVLDSRESPNEPLERPDAIEALSSRRTGVGADGVVFLAAPERPGAVVAMRYYNSDGSRATFCGNATLCITRLAHDLGLSPGGSLALETDAGVIRTRMGAAGPEIELPPVTEVVKAVALQPASGETRIGFALAGVPHLIVLCAEVDDVQVAERGAMLRNTPWRAGGVNVNFVSRRGDGWAIRTYERGIEGETLACGTGAMAAAILLTMWKAEAGDTTSLLTRSGRTLRVTLHQDRSKWYPTLSGEGRIVYVGELAEWSGSTGAANG